MWTVTRLFFTILLGAGALVLFAISNLSAPHGFQSRPSAALGVTFGQRTGEMQLIVDSIRPDSAAARAGLQVGDRIEALDGSSGATIDALDRDVVERRDIELDVKRGTNSFHVRIAKTAERVIGRQDPIDRGRSSNV